MKRQPSCFGCIHLRYRGPHGILEASEIEDSDGHYACNLFDSQPIAPSDAKPEPLTNDCKDTLS